jgi:hypothetical protein
VERWFGLITQRAIRRGSFSGVKELIAKIEQFVAAYNKTKAPFNWTGTADSIPPSAWKDDASPARPRPTTRGLDGAEQCVVTARWSKLM